MVRRAIAGIGLALIAILLILGVRGCLNARKEQAIEDYATDSAELLLIEAAGRSALGSR